MNSTRTLQMLVGLLAAALALGVAELAAALLGATSLVIAVADVVVDNTPGAVIKQAIDALGTNDKPFLLVTVTLVTLVIGPLLGPLAARRPRVGQIAFAAFGALGIAAAIRDPATSLLVASLVATAASIAGLLTLRALLAAVTPEAPACPVATLLPLPGRGVAGRRRFLTYAAATAGGAAAAAVTGRFLIGPAVDVEAQRQAIVFSPLDGKFISTRAGIEVPGIAPLITPNKDFYRIDTALTVPRIDASTWRLRITGMVDRPYELTFAELLAMPPIEEVITLACVSNEVGGDLVGNAVWRGVPLADILKRAGVQSGASQIVGRATDGFTVGFPTHVALDGRTSMVAVGMNGEPLPVDHGFPARLVIPGLYGYVSATKWLSEIELTRFEAYDAYWIERGWDKESPIITQSRIDVPQRGQTLTAGRLPIAGVAWAGDKGIGAVEVNVRARAARDPKPNWIPARLSEALSGTSWRQWVVEWDAEPGAYTIEVRATNARGEPQIGIDAPPLRNAATGYHRVNVTIRA